MKKKVLCLLMCLAMVASVLAGCGSKKADETTAAKKEEKTTEAKKDETTTAAKADETTAAKSEGGSEGGKYGCAVPNAQNSFYATCVSGVEEGVKQYDPTASVVVTDASGDSQKQMDQIADLVSQGCKAIICIPIDSNAIIPALEEAAKAGVPVVCMDTPAGETDAVVSTVVSNNYSAGEIAGRALLEGIGGKGKIATITTTGSEAVNDRKQALYDLIEKEFPDVEIVQEEIVQNATTEEALTLMENICQANPDLSGVFTTGDVFAIGICSALQSNGYQPGDVKVTSVDGTTNAVELIESGYLLATAAQLPKDLGIHSVKNALDYLNGKDVEKLENLDCKEVNKDNASTYEGF
ncbi:sugar ABC transporter substrate-binding protein [Lacrimispora sp. NSJ-141]|uniref:Sugar ABC transporter substrate-binding protein n=1 Tax=Lientehia hominis TaxID=2897778 RepID=A0AAP2RHJ8_9FIRM|nr:sugar ABC transporter substrate-binding protein [Lientehia hominis]MCD2491901.1 sugar ABC transporter substrate-binding protein [Lientehia hominis]